MDLDTLITKIAENIINPTLLLLFALALVYFLWGVLKYIREADKAASREEGASHMLWGVVGMAIMIGAYTLIKIVVGTFGIEAPDNILK